MHTGNNADKDPSPSELRIMTFSMMSIRMGVDVGQVFQMLEPRQAAAQDLRVVSLHERLSFGERRVRYESPRVLLLRNAGHDGVLIDQPEDITLVKVDCLRPLPPLLEAHRENGIVWAVALIDEEIVLLVDLYKVVAL